MSHFQIKKISEVYKTDNSHILKIKETIVNHLWVK